MSNLIFTAQSEYYKVIKAIPVPLKTVIQQLLVHSNIKLEMKPLFIKCTNYVFEKCLSTQYHPNLLKRKYVLQEFSEEEARKKTKGILLHLLNGMSIKAGVL